MIIATISPYSSLVDYIIPVPKSHTVNLLRNILLVVSFSIFIALSARVAIPIPFITPVPITLQTLIVLLTGAALGSRRGGLAVLLYIAEGAGGIPVFAGGVGGFIRLFGITGGFLWAFPIAAFVTGWLCEKRLDRSFKTSVLAMLPGTLIIYALGVSWMAFELHLSLPVALAQGMIPFIPGDILKLFVAAGLLPTVWKGLQLKEHKK